MPDLRRLASVRPFRVAETALRTLYDRVADIEEVFMLEDILKAHQVESVAKAVLDVEPSVAPYMEDSE